MVESYSSFQDDSLDKNEETSQDGIMVFDADTNHSNGTGGS